MRGKNNVHKENEWVFLYVEFEFMQIPCTDEIVLVFPVSISFEEPLSFSHVILNPIQVNILILL